eukprot:TRINITY_DN21005_c0_g1_i1.p1 TRINITY_DN21005_c0_g1~~TRINITY_DN21005_c0_g1_i1.p1  ORF type:complete len:101 (+),score=20.60 TRINITY_DN21005_c0_g1_i1:244-546(+)
MMMEANDKIKGQFKEYLLVLQGNINGMIRESMYRLKSREQEEETNCFNIQNMNEHFTKIKNAHLCLLKEMKDCKQLFEKCKGFDEATGHESLLLLFFVYM